MSILFKHGYTCNASFYHKLILNNLTMNVNKGNDEKID